MTNSDAYTCDSERFDVVPMPNGYKITAHYEAFIESNRQENELDQIEIQVEKIGQHLKRRIYGETIQAADQHASELVQATSDEWIKNGTKPFTLMTRFGKVQIQRQQLRKKTQKQ